MRLSIVHLHRPFLLAAGGAVAAAVLAACGTSNGSSGTQLGTGTGASASAMGAGMGGGMGSAGPAAGAHNAADVAFVTQMIPHHTQAVAMAALAATRAGSPQVKSLAAQIKAAQGPEITEMAGWLRGWGAGMASGGMSAGGMSSPSAAADASGMGGGSMSGDGMMSNADMARLATLSGTAFDRQWLTMMTGHHRGAVTMAHTELGVGANAQAKALARSIITSQTAQITRMRALLGQLPAS